MKKILINGLLILTTITTVQANNEKTDLVTTKVKATTAQTNKPQPEIKAEISSISKELEDKKAELKTITEQYNEAKHKYKRITTNNFNIKGYKSKKQFKKDNEKFIASFNNKALKGKPGSVSTFNIDNAESFTISLDVNKPKRPNIDINDIKIIDNNGKSYKFQTWYDGNNRLNKNIKKNNKILESFKDYREKLENLKITVKDDFMSFILNNKVIHTFELENPFALKTIIIDGRIDGLEVRDE